MKQDDLHDDKLKDVETNKIDEQREQPGLKKEGDLTHKKIDDQDIDEDDKIDDIDRKVG